ncbi:MAG TPA: ATP-dependent protease, Lon family, partial [Firmicutes bacterium]|nr:ATP-dependent protease, Lon family [Bacillota bacterium]
QIEKKILGLKRIVYEDPTLDDLPNETEIKAVLAEIEEEIAEILARKTVEDNIEKKISTRLQEKHEEYLQEIKIQILKEEGSTENPYTLKKYALLEKKKALRLAKTAMDYLRPDKLDEIVGQTRGIKALMAKIASPYPQHIIIYGPPGVGKTTAARLVLEAARNMPHTHFAKDAPFVEVDGTTLRFDPRETTNPLIGSVHDPIYQGARKDLVEGGIPEPKTGLVTEAHGGILFIDEIGEMDEILQRKILKVLEDKKVKFESSYYDPSDPQVPKYVKNLFEEGAPADFILIGATTRLPEEINPALRSRCSAVFFDPLTEADIMKIVENAARRLKIRISPGAARLISQYTREGRQAINILADAYGFILNQKAAPTGCGNKGLLIREETVREVVQASRLSRLEGPKGLPGKEIGKIFGLGVSGHVGSVLEIEAIAFKATAKGKGRLRFNETAGTMTKDSVFNAASLIRRYTGKDIDDYDLHVNVVGGGNVDGPSAGAAILLVLLSALEGKPLRQDMAVTGEVSLRGKLKPVGGLAEKIHGACAAGLKRVIVPAENKDDIPTRVGDCEILPVEDLEDVFRLAF